MFCRLIFWYNITAQKMQFSITDFFSKCDPIRSSLRIWSNLKKEPIMERKLFLCSVWPILYSSQPIRLQIFCTSAITSFKCHYLKCCILFGKFWFILRSKFCIFHLRLTLIFSKVNLLKGTNAVLKM